MNKKTFLTELSELFELEREILETDKLSEIEEFDSLAFLALIAFFDKNFNMRLSGDDIKEFETVLDIIKKGGNNITN